MLIPLTKQYKLNEMGRQLWNFYIAQEHARSMQSDDSCLHSPNDRGQGLIHPAVFICSQPSFTRSAMLQLDHTTCIPALKRRQGRACERCWLYRHISSACPRAKFCLPCRHQLTQQVDTKSNLDINTMPSGWTGKRERDLNDDGQGDQRAAKRIVYVDCNLIARWMKEANHHITARSKTLATALPSW